MPQDIGVGDHEQLGAVQAFDQRQQVLRKPVKTAGLDAYLVGVVGGPAHVEDCCAG